jgi:hypothetical protein
MFFKRLSIKLRSNIYIWSRGRLLKPRQKLWDIYSSPQFDQPGTWLQMGDKVRAIRTVYDLPGNTRSQWWNGTWGPIAAEKGHIGTVEHVQDGLWPTVRFDISGRATCVTDFEVEKIA